ncbi:trafficking protein particle complex subunit 8 [Ostrinia furnacalis]|uniref:trafficking protein particle complex subunit 8 n=1 Tax=Ostrinia furnacalis TaxID=93504 RepID=UPI00103AA8B9|nr:trafficking protein particle complex subunit 8 [Ostrinia furnacalis]
MAKAGKTAQEFIQSSFSPIVAVLCSPKVENVVSKNNLTFPELIQPFSTLDWEGQFREPGGSSCSVKSWKLIIRDVNWKPLQPTDARRQLNNAVLHNFNDKTVSLDIDGRKFDVSQATPWFDAWRETYLEVQFPSDHEFTKHFLSCIIVGSTQDENIIDCFNSLNQQYAQLQNITPPKLPKWFNNGVLKSYLLLHDVSSMAKDKADAVFETVKQTFGANNCFMLSINSKSNIDPTLTNDYWAQYITRTTETNNEMASATSNLPTTPLEAQTPLNQSVPAIQSDDSNILTSSNQDTSHPLTESDVYDNANSLQTHSFSGSSESMSVTGKAIDYSSEVHGAALNANDIEAIKKFLVEYASKALLPYLEKQISLLSEVVANRKGVSRSLLSATKRWFGTGKTGNTTANNTVIYTNDCPELQLRRLGDLWFMCGQWQRAFDAYHTAKREFYADSAWLCYAGALEMAAISAFMSGESNRKTHGYMEESITTYLNTCRMVQYAVRATLLSVLCLGGSGLPGEAAKQLIRMTSEDSDLRSAMLLEQAALCFLSGPGTKAMCRKYAFHMVLAGHRFSKAGQKKHAYRCYKQAYQVYQNSGWRLSTDHVQFALGRLAGALKLTGDAVSWLAAPLAPSSHQPPHQQDAFLREYILAHQQWIESCEEFRFRLPPLPLPLLARGATAVLCVGPAPLSAPGRAPASSIALHDAAAPAGEDDRYWHKLEEMLLQVAQGSVPMIFKPTVDLYVEGTDANPIVPKGEPIQIAITLRNPLKISLILKDVELLWQFISNPEYDQNIDHEVLNNEPVVAAGSTLESNVIVGQKIKSVLFEGDCEKVLTFTITPLCVGQINIHGLAYKLINAGEGGNETGNGTMISGKVDLTSQNSVDKRLQIKVIPEAPCLQMTFTEMSPEAISNELRIIDVELRNVGPVDMKNVHIAVSHPDCISLITEDAGDNFKALYDEKYRELPPFNDERAARAAAWRAASARHVSSAAGVVARAACRRLRLLLRPRAAAPALRLLAYYETGAAARPYRLLRHVFRLQVAEAVEVSVTPRRSLKTFDGEVLENLFLAVELKNICNEKEDNVVVEVLEASLLSRQWKLTGLTKVADKVNPLAVHERLHLIFNGRRIFEMLPEEKVEHTCLKVGSTNLDSSFASCYNFITDFKPSYLDTTDGSQEQQRQGLIQSMFVIRWKATNKSNGKSTFGQNCLWLECFAKTVSRNKDPISIDLPTLQLDDGDNKKDTKDPKQKVRKDNVIFRLEHCDTIQHDFKHRKLCLVPITINIVNCYGVPVTVFIDMSKQQSREALGELGWAGALSNALDADEKKTGVSVSLEKFESRRVQVRALCAAPGTYLVGSAFSITTLRADNQQPITHMSNNTSLLVVQQVCV